MGRARLTCAGMRRFPLAGAVTPAYSRPPDPAHLQRRWDAPDRRRRGDPRRGHVGQGPSLQGARGEAATLHLRHPRL